MELSKSPDTDRIRRPTRRADAALTALVDSLVQAVDMNRDYEVNRLRNALEPFGATALFDAELRLNGIASLDEWCICGGEVF